MSYGLTRPNGEIHLMRGDGKTHCRKYPTERYQKRDEITGPRSVCTDCLTAKRATPSEALP